MSRTLLYVALAAATLNGFAAPAIAAGKPDKTLTPRRSSLSPDEKTLYVAAAPKPPQNLAFAGPGSTTLYVVGRGAVWKIETETSGPANRAK